MSDRLTPALRQYQHNDCSGVVPGYDLQETNRIVAEMEVELEDQKIFLLQINRMVRRGYITLGCARNNELRELTEK